MNYFSAVKLASFAEKLFASAGLDFSAIAKDGNADALKAALERAKAEGAAGNVEASDKVKTIQAALDSAFAENTAAAEKHAAFAKAVADAGVKVSAEADAAAIKAAVEARASAKASEIVAATGTAPLSENVTADAGAANGKQSKEITHAEFSKLTPGAKMRFCKSGGRVTDLPISK
jgi:hypothetical protein